MAVLGDSLSTGAATHPALVMDAGQLWQVFDAKTPLVPRADALPDDALPPDVRATPGDVLPPPARPWPSRREFFGGAAWVHRNLMAVVARRYLDTPEYSWGYQVAAALHPGALADRAAALAVVAENGARTETLPVQLERLLQETGGVLPRRLFVFYTGNDLCGQSLRQAVGEDEYRRALRHGLGVITRTGRVPEGGTDVYLMGFLGVLQLQHEPSILAKRVRAYGGEETCGELRARGFRPPPDAPAPSLPDEARWFGLVMPPNPAAYCATLFPTPGPGTDELVQSLANRIRSFREIQRAAIAAAQADPTVAARQPALRFHYVDETETVGFTGDDIAGDCFHLSPQGHGKVAKAVLRHLERR